MHLVHRYHAMEASAPLLTHVLQAFPRDPVAAGWLQSITAVVAEATGVSPLAATGN